MRTVLLLLGSLVLAACGGKVVVDGQGDPGAGGGTTTSSSTASTGSSSSTGGAACPAFLQIQAPCEVAGQVCPVLLSCCGGSAVCNESGVWEYQAVECGEPCVFCSPALGCSFGTLCVFYLADSGESYGCREDPCPGSSDCDCAKSICEEAALSCQSHGQDLLVCDCPTC